MFCERCGAKRPEEPRPLWEVLSEPQYSHEEYGKKDAMISLKWFEDNYPKQKLGEANNIYGFRFMDWLNREKEKCK